MHECPVTITDRFRCAPEEERVVTIDRALWAKSFAPDDLPNWPCPNCGKHKLVVEKKRKAQLMPAHIIKLRKHPDWEFDWDVAHVSIIAKCANPSCGEYVSVVGRSTFYESYNEDDEVGGTTIEHHVQVHAVYPAPAIFKIPDSVPKTVSDHIQRSFSLFWMDAGACAAVLRAAVERLLDHLKIPIEGTNKKGDTVRFDLNRRIDLVGNMKLGDKDSLHALRTVGNLGAHGAKVESDSVLDAMELIEESLLEILKIREKNIKALQAKLKGLNAPKKTAFSKK